MPHGTCGFSHFSTPMCNRQRQAVSDGINSKPEYSGGQWFLNHLCGWNRSASSLHNNNTLVTRVGAESFQQGLWQLKTCVYFVCFSGDGRLFRRRVTAALWWNGVHIQSFPIESHLSSYIRCEGGQNQLLIKVRRDKLYLKEVTEKYQCCTSYTTINIILL